MFNGVVHVWCCHTFVFDYFVSQKSFNQKTAKCTLWFQRQQPISGGTIRSARHANCCQHIPPCRFLDSFPDPSQFAALS